MLKQIFLHVSEMWIVKIWHFAITVLLHVINGYIKNRTWQSKFINLLNMNTLIPYRAVNTLLPDYKKRSVNAVQ